MHKANAAYNTAYSPSPSLVITLLFFAAVDLYCSLISPKQEGLISGCGFPYVTFIKSLITPSNMGCGSMSSIGPSNSRVGCGSTTAANGGKMSSAVLLT